MITIDNEIMHLYSIR